MLVRNQQLSPRMPMVHEQIALQCAKNLCRAASVQGMVPRMPFGVVPMVVDLQPLDEDVMYRYMVSLPGGGVATESPGECPSQMFREQMNPPCPMHGSCSSSSSSLAVPPCPMHGGTVVGSQLKANHRQVALLSASSEATALAEAADLDSTHFVLAQQALHKVQFDARPIQQPLLNKDIITFNGSLVALDPPEDIRAHFAAALQQQRNCQRLEGAQRNCQRLEESEQRNGLNGHKVSGSIDCKQLQPLNGYPKLLNGYPKLLNGYSKPLNGYSKLLNGYSKQNTVEPVPELVTPSSLPQLPYGDFDELNNEPDELMDTLITGDALPFPSASSWGDYPAELQTLFTWNYCSLCRTSMQTMRNAVDHYSSRAHDRRASSWLVRHCCEEGAMSDEVLRYLRSAGPAAFYCELCDLKLTSVMHAQQHFFGRRHRLVARNAAKPNGAGYYDEEGKWVRTDAKWLMCELCDVSITSESQMAMHMAGARHRKRLHSAYSGYGVPVDGSHLYRIDANGSLAPLNPLGFYMYAACSKSEIRKMSDLNAAYYCEVCNITLNHLKSVKQHEEGRMHRKKLDRVTVRVAFT